MLFFFPGRFRYPFGVNEFGTWLKNLRESKEFSQKDLADHLNVDLRSVTRWETGEGIPNRNMIGRIARLAGEDPAWLVAAVKGGSKLPEYGAKPDVRVPFYAEGKIRQWAREAGMPPSEWVGRLVRWIEKPPPLFQTFVKESVREGFEPSFDAVMPDAQPPPIRLSDSRGRAAEATVKE